MKLSKTQFRCKSTTIYARAQIIMLQNMPLMFRRNKSRTFCNILKCQLCFVTANWEGVRSTLYSIW